MPTGVKPAYRARGRLCFYRPPITMTRCWSRSGQRAHRQRVARWKPGFDNTKAGKMKASVRFKFAKRGATTPLRTRAAFLYSETDAAGKTKDTCTSMRCWSRRRVEDGDGVSENEATKAGGRVAGEIIRQRVPSQTRDVRHKRPPI